MADILNNIKKKLTYNFKCKSQKIPLSIGISILALIISVVSYYQSRSSDLYNRKTSPLSYSYNLSKDQDEDKKNIKLVDRDTDEEIDAEIGKKVIMNVNTGLPAKRKFILMKSTNKIYKMINFYSGEGVNGINVEGLKYEIYSNQMSAYKLRDDYYISYYFIYTEAINGARSIDCVINLFHRDGDGKYELKKTKVLDSLELEMKYIDMSEAEEDVHNDIFNFFHNEIVNSYEILKNIVKESNLE